VAEPLTPLDVYNALAVGAGGPIARQAVVVSGPEAGAYLQGQLSQDVPGLAPGRSAWSWVLQPTGKVDVLVRVTRTEGDTWVLDTDAGFGQALVTRLSRFKLRTKADIELLDWHAVGLRGAGLTVTASDGGSTVSAPDGGITVSAPDGGSTVSAPDGGIAVDAGWAGLPGLDLLGPDPVLPDGLVPVDEALWEVARIEAGFPRMGAELTESTIPAETGLVTAAVSFTKGCYTGQELVARIDSRGNNVPRHLRGLLLSGPSEVGAVIAANGKPVGALTSVARSPALGWVALAYVSRSVTPGDVVMVDGGPGAEVRDLPLRP
jgi:folate-binding protein YgfZ